MKPEIIALGTSMGGLHALQTLLPGLPGKFSVPLVIVQHRGRQPGGEGLSTLLQQACELPVEEPDDKDPILGGHVYIAPADYHLLVERGRIALSTAEPDQRARPSIDALFESTANAYREGAVAVILTGASADGARGAARIKALGGRVVVEDPATAESPIMPKAAIAATHVDRVLPLREIAAFLVTMCSAQGRPLA